MKRIMTALNRSETLRRGLTNGVLASGFLLGLTGLAACGADFQNLDFEDGPSYSGTGFFPPSQYPDVMPGWTVNAAGVGQTNAYCNEFILDLAGVALMTRNSGLGQNYVIAGDRSVYLQSASSNPFDNVGSAINVSISQVGMVPEGTQSLLFDARNQWYGPVGVGLPVPPGPFQVTMGGVSVPLFTLTSDGGNATYGANIANWAGQTTELSIGVLASPAWGGSLWEGWAVVDSISFSPLGIPEPSAFSLFGLGALLLGLLRRRKRG